MNLAADITATFSYIVVVKPEINYLQHYSYSNVLQLQRQLVFKKRFDVLLACQNSASSVNERLGSI